MAGAEDDAGRPAMFARPAIFAVSWDHCRVALEDANEQRLTMSPQRRRVVPPSGPPGKFLTEERNTPSNTAMSDLI